MFKLFKAIGRFFRAFLYSCAGDFSKWSENMETNTGYVTAEYEDIQSDQVRSIKDTTDAVAGLMDIVGQKEHRLKTLTQQIEDLRKKQVPQKETGRSPSQGKEDRSCTSKIWEVNGGNPERSHCFEMLWLF